MQSLTETAVSCPYCAELINVLIDPEEAGHQYTEDCQVCCQPIVFHVEIGVTDELHVSVRSENEAY